VPSCNRRLGCQLRRYPFPRFPRTPFAWQQTAKGGVQRRIRPDSLHPLPNLGGQKKNFEAKRVFRSDPSVSRPLTDSAPLFLTSVRSYHMAFCFFSPSFFSSRERVTYVHPGKLGTNKWRGSAPLIADRRSPTSGSGNGLLRGGEMTGRPNECLVSDYRTPWKNAHGERVKPVRGGTIEDGVV